MKWNTDIPSDYINAITDIVVKTCVPIDYHYFQIIVNAKQS